MVDKPVYSTSSSQSVAARRDEPAKADWRRSAGPLKMRLETKGRGGKAVTVLFSLPFDRAAAEKLLKEMQGAFGCGGTVDDAASSLELRGDVRDKAEQFLNKRGVKVVRAGG